jgi:hypothetical protein
MGHPVGFPDMGVHGPVDRLEDTTADINQPNLSNADLFRSEVSCVNDQL